MGSSRRVKKWSEEQKLNIYIFSFYQIFLYFRPVTTKFLETCPIGVGDVATFIAHCKTKTTPVFSAKATFGVEELATFTAQRKFTVSTHTNYFFFAKSYFSF